MESILDVALKDENFKEVYDFGIKNYLITPFSEFLFDQTRGVYIKDLDMSLYDYFMDGNHIGRCFTTAYYLSELFDEFTVYRGFLPAIQGTKNSINGNHAWLVSDGYIYDTSLLLKIDEQLAEYLGYKIEAPCLSNTTIKNKKSYNN